MIYQNVRIADDATPEVFEITPPKTPEDFVRELMLHGLPKHGTPAADLTDTERLALALAAGATFEVDGLPGWATIRTKQLVGVTDRGDGGYVVAIGPQTSQIGK